jgi:hypothetical protein
VNDDASTAFDHPRDHVFAREDGSQQIDIEARSPGGGVIAHGEGRDVVDEDVDAPQFLSRSVEKRAQRVGVADVAGRTVGAGRDFAKLGLHACKRFGAPGAGRHRGSFRCKREGHRSADAFAPARHDDTFSAETQVQNVPPLFSKA